MFPKLLPSPVPSRRRRTLIEALGGAPVLIPAGGFVGRNYPANVYGFRASSHFLYYMGEAGAYLPYSWLYLDSAGAVLFSREPTANDALWHGPTPTLKELSKILGLPTRDIAQLDSFVKDKGPAGLPVTDLKTAAQQSALLGREVDILSEGPDRNLAVAVIQQRLIHDAGAKAELHQAASATHAAHVAGMRATRPGLHEHHIRAAMLNQLHCRGMTNAYPAIVTVNGEVLHNNAYHNKLAEGDLVLADVGAETAAGWAGDVTRTWPVSGTYDAAQRDMYEAVLAAQMAAIDMVRPGVRYRDIHLAGCLRLTEGLIDLGILKGSAADLVDRDVHALFFPHGMGHLIGLDVHDMEDLGDLAGYEEGFERSERFGLGFLRLDRTLAPGMAVTIEPGFYQVPAILENDTRREGVGDAVDWQRLKAFSTVRGIRIEDDVLVTDADPLVLTADIPKTVSDVESTIRG